MKEINPKKLHQDAGVYKEGHLTLLNQLILPEKTQTSRQAIKMQQQQL
jgi:hypothetical protein